MISQELIDQIVSWKKQGYSEDSIMQYLQTQGYSDSDIFAALNQAKIIVSKPQQDVKQQSQQQDRVNKEGSDEDNNVDTEELIEQIIDEKWQDISEDIKKITDWKSGIESSISRMDERLKAVENRLDLLYKSLIEKIADYDKHISTVAGELKAVEKAFSSFLPEFNKTISNLKQINTKKKKN